MFTLPRRAELEVMVGIVRKGSRLITVDGQRYRWIVAPDDEPGLGVVVEGAERPAQRLFVWLDYGNIVSPKLVRDLVRLGLQQGWTPQQPGRELTLRVKGIVSDVVDFRTARLNRRGAPDTPSITD